MCYGNKPAGTRKVAVLLYSFGSKPLIAAVMCYDKNRPQKEGQQRFWVLAGVDGFNFLSIQRALTQQPGSYTHHKLNAQRLEHR